MTRYFWEFLLVAFPKALNGAATILVNILLARFLGPDAFGIFSICMTAVLLSDGVVGSAFDLGVMRLAPLARAKQRLRSLNFERAALVLKLGVAAAIASVLALFSGPLSRIAFQRSDGGRFILLSCLAALGLLTVRSVQVHFQVDKRFGLYGLVDLLNSGLKYGGIALALLLLPPSPTTLLTIVATVPWVVVGISGLTFGRTLFAWEPGIRAVVGELWEFVRWPLITFCVTTLATRLDIALLALLSNPSEVGIFSLGQTLTMIPELLGMYLSVIVAPRLMPSIRQGFFSRFFTRFQLAMLGLAIIGWGIAWVGLNLARSHLWPANYDRSEAVLWVLLPGSLAAMINFPLVVAFLMFVRPSFLFKIELLILPLAVLAYPWAIHEHGAVGAAVVATILRLLKAVLALSFAWVWARSAEPLIPDEPTAQLAPQ